MTSYINGNKDFNGDGTISGSLPETPTAVFGGGDIFIAAFMTTMIWKLFA